MIWRIIGFIAAGLTMFSFFPQIFKILKTKSARDMSLVTLLQLSSGVSLWILYGLYLKDAIIITANSVTLVSLVALLVLYFSYKKGRV
jgi:MtN3 and saliva related transmembrane protein